MTGQVLYSATRSTGQVEEGPVGFSLVTLDGDAVCWNFVPLDAPEVVTIVAPADRRLTLDGSEENFSSEVSVRAKLWSRETVTRVTAMLEGVSTELLRGAGGLWSGVMETRELTEGRKRITVEAMAGERRLFSAIEIVVGASASRHREPVDQQNAIGAWEERGIVGTQLGPNKNGRKW